MVTWVLVVSREKIERKASESNFRSMNPGGKEAHKYFYLLSVKNKPTQPFHNLASIELRTIVL
jgi:hypothetical protein